MHITGSGSCTAVVVIARIMPSYLLVIGFWSLNQGRDGIRAREISPESTGLRNVVQAGRVTGEGGGTGPKFLDRVLPVFAIRAGFHPELMD